MEAIALARSLRGSIGMLAMEWLMADSTMAYAAARGSGTGMGAYAVGRLGVLGDCPPDNVVGAAFFWEPERMRTMVTEGRAATTTAAGTAAFVEACQAWGEAKLAELDGVERLGELCEAVVAAASPNGAPTFVGWRDQPLPEQAGPARTFQLCQVMRELRFARHTVAVQSVGISPLEAILAGPAGDWNAEMFGWAKPYPDVAHLAEVREQAEALTDRLHAADVEVLSADERAELRNLAKAARAHAGERPEPTAGP